jgi:hypothetical protein
VGIRCVDDAHTGRCHSKCVALCAVNDHGVPHLNELCHSVLCAPHVFNPRTNGSGHF